MLACSDNDYFDFIIKKIAKNTSVWFCQPFFWAQNVFYKVSKF